MVSLYKIFLLIGLCSGFLFSNAHTQTTLSAVLRTNSLINIPANETWELLSAESSQYGSTSFANKSYAIVPILVINCAETEFSFYAAPTTGSADGFWGSSSSTTWVWSGNEGSLPVSGPATLSMRLPGAENFGSGGSTIFLAYKKMPSQNIASNISSTSVVIPTSASGDVDVKLEQSADNVTWTECLPGTYNSSTVKRFFRLRAVEK